MSKRGFLWKEVEEEKKSSMTTERSFFYTKAFFIGLEPIFFCSDLTLRVYYEFVVISLGFKQALVCDSYNQNLLLLELNYSRLKRGVENDI